MTDKTTADLPAIETHSFSNPENGFGYTQYFGTREQLINAGLATARMFPPKRHWAYSTERTPFAARRWHLQRDSKGVRDLLYYHELFELEPEIQAAREREARQRMMRRLRDMLGDGGCHDE